MLKKLIKKLNNPPLSHREQGIFAERLSLLLGASLSLPESIAIMRRSFGKRRCDSLAMLENSLNNGMSFESALSGCPLGFSRMMILAARIGERSGTLSESLLAAAGRIERSRAVKSGLLSAMTYPAIIFMASAGIISFLVFFIIPKIMPTIESLHMPLPWITIFFISLSHFLANDWWKIFLGLFAIAIVLSFVYKGSMWFKNLIHQLILYIPIARRVIQTHILSEIFDTVSTLVSAGCPFIDSIAESSASIGFVPYERALSNAVKEMRIGSDFSSAIRNSPRLFPGLAVDSIAIGERTGNMESILAQMSRYYASELATGLAGLLKLIEPALLIAVGIIVGAAALSIVLPIYGISQHLSG
jgi:type IV pilus assembly protein PilC